MAELFEITAALAELLDGTIDRLSVFGERPGTVPVLPAAWPQPSTAEYAVRTEKRGLDTYEISLIIAVSMADIRIAQKEMAPLLAKRGPSSIRQPDRENPHLGLDDATVAWVDRMVYGTDPFPGTAQNVLGAVLYVHVRTDG